MANSSPLTLDQLVGLRRDLEKRMLIDINQFHEDTGCNVKEIRLITSMHVGRGPDEVIAVEIQLETPR